MRSHPTEKLDYIKILTYCNLYLYSYFLFSLPSKFLTKPLRVLENEVNKTNKQTNKQKFGILASESLIYTEDIYIQIGA